MSRKDLATRSGVAYSTLADIENEATHKCTSIAQLSDILGVVPLWLEVGRHPMRAESVAQPEPALPYLCGALFEDLTALLPEDASVWCAQIRAAAIKVRREKGEPEPPAIAPKGQRFA
jgi:hypothetical protein